MAGPLEQFEIKPIVAISIGELDLSFTNSALWMVFAATTITLLLLAGTRRRSMVPNRIQAFGEMLYTAVAGMVRDNAGADGRPYFPFIFTLFVFILFGNVMGLIPGSFTFTSHIIVTFALAAFIFVAVTIIGFVKNGAGYLSIFLPSGLPFYIVPIVLPIEIVSYLSRPISLGVRLFANMTVGHVILKIVTGFVITLGILGGIFPLVFLVAIYALELLVAVVQAYVFAILTCIYLADALHPHH